MAGTGKSVMGVTCVGGWEENISWLGVPSLPLPLPLLPSVSHPPGGSSPGPHGDTCGPTLSTQSHGQHYSPSYRERHRHRKTSA